MMLVTLVGSIVFAIWVIDRNIAQHIAAATNVARKISAGNFSNEIIVKGHDEAAQMLRALKTMQESLAQYRETLRKSEEQTRLLRQFLSMHEGMADLSASPLPPNPSLERQIVPPPSAPRVGAAPPR